jgi:glutathione S-transferase
LAGPILTITSRNYGSWSLRGWLLCRLAGLDVEVRVLSLEEDSARAELLLLSPSFLVPRLEHDGIAVWDTLAIVEYLNELPPEAGLLPADPAQRAHCRSLAGEMHSGFANLRSALPMNIKARHPGFRVVSGAQADVDRILAIWRECLGAHGGPFLFGAAPDARRRDVRARVLALSHLRHRARRAVRRLRRHDPRPRRDGRVDRRRTGRARAGRRARDRVLTR